MAATQFTMKIGEEVFDPNVATGVAARDPANGDHCEVLFLEGTVTNKVDALEMLKRIMVNIETNDWPLA